MQGLGQEPPQSPAQVADPCPRQAATKPRLQPDLDQGFQTIQRNGLGIAGWLKECGGEAQEKFVLPWECSKGDGCFVDCLLCCFKS